MLAIVSRERSSALMPGASIRKYCLPEDSLAILLTFVHPSFIEVRLQLQKSRAKIKFQGLLLMMKSGELTRSIWLSSGTLFVASIEAVCLFFVSASGVALLLGGSTVVLSQSLLFFHQAAIRIPILAIATLGALLNLGLLWNQHRLRTTPSARWRMEPLTTRDRRKIILVTAMSVLTLLVVCVELYLHHKFHGSALA